MRKRNIMTESTIRRIVKESIKRVISEDKRHKQSKFRTLEVIRNFCGPNCGDEYEILDAFEDDFYRLPEYKSGQMMRLEPLFCKYALEANFHDPNRRDIQKLSNIKTIMHKMNGLSKRGQLDLSKYDLNTPYEVLDGDFGKASSIDVDFDSNRMFGGRGGYGGYGGGYDGGY